VYVIDRVIKQQIKEDVYFEGAIRFLYGNCLFSRIFGRIILHTIAKWPFFSALFGRLQNCSFSKRKILPFIARYKINTEEFEKAPDAFSSFNDFFIRKLKTSCRPVTQTSAIIPADGRYTFLPEAGPASTFQVKGATLSIFELLANTPNSHLFTKGATVIIARLCPTDCHRFYFPCDGTPEAPILIKGPLYSVHPIADYPTAFVKNKRTITYMDTPSFGTIVIVTVGATNVGSINHTFTPNTHVQKGSEMGYFAFGGSALVLLFQPNTITLSPDLKAPSELETLCLIGQPLGQ